MFLWGCNGIQTHNHLVRKRTLNHLDNERNTIEMWIQSEIRTRHDQNIQFLWGVLTERKCVSW